MHHHLASVCWRAEFEVITFDSDIQFSEPGTPSSWLAGRSQYPVLNTGIYRIDDDPGLMTCRNRPAHE